MRSGADAQEVTPWPEAAQWRDLLEDLIAERDGLPPQPRSSQAREDRDRTGGSRDTRAADSGTDRMPGPCPRRRAEQTEITAESPQPGCWTLYRCTTCWYIWRSSEPPTASDPEQYPVAFRLDAQAVAAPPELT